MVFEKLFGNKKKWPDGIPQLYPDHQGPELCDFLSREQFEAAKQYPKVMICPFFSTSQQASDSESNMIGIGLARLLIRDLMLVGNLSVRGPEDTLKAPRELVRGYFETADKDSTIFVTGKYSYEHAHILRYETWQDGKMTGATTVKESDFHRFLTRCAESMLLDVGGEATIDVAEKWEVSRPADQRSLAELGKLVIGEEDEADKNAFARMAHGDDPGFGLPLTEISDDQSLDHLLKAFEIDPYDAQCCFLLFIAIWQSDGTFEPAALQFLRRAIELSPGHGKAHMCAPHAAHPKHKPKMITHSELGYRLLPGNSFAINNYILNLQNAKAPTEKIYQLAMEGIKSDPHDPANYERMMTLFIDSKDFAHALAIAEELQRLYEPNIDERALYCLQQNPRAKEMLEAGSWDPAAENRKRIRELKSSVR